MKGKISLGFITLLMILSVISFSAYAVDPLPEVSGEASAQSEAVSEAPDSQEDLSGDDTESEDSVTENSEEYESSDAESYYEEDTTESYYQSSADYYEESYYEDSYTESYYEESYTESSEESYYESSDDYEESIYEESSIEVKDPFKETAALKYIIPADDPDFRKKEDSEAQSSSGGTIGSEKDVLAPPPQINTDSGSASTDPAGFQETDNSTLTGIIFWSVLGIILVVTLIILISNKGNNNSNFGRKRYYKKGYTRSKYK